MKKYTYIILIIVIATLMIGVIVFLKKGKNNSDINNTMKNNSSLNVDLQQNSSAVNSIDVKLKIKDGFDYNETKGIQKYNEIELTQKEKEKIIEYYNKTSKKELSSDEIVELAFLGTIELEFSDGNSIAMDDNDDNYAMFNKEFTIKISQSFKDYILTLIHK